MLYSIPFNNINEKQMSLREAFKNCTRNRNISCCIVFPSVNINEKQMSQYNLRTSVNLAICLGSLIHDRSHAALNIEYFLLSFLRLKPKYQIFVIRSVGNTIWILNDTTKYLIDNKPYGLRWQFKSIMLLKINELGYQQYFLNFCFNDQWFHQL